MCIWELSAILHELRAFDYRINRDIVLNELTCSIDMTEVLYIHTAVDDLHRNTLDMLRTKTARRSRTDRKTSVGDEVKISMIEPMNSCTLKNASWADKQLLIYRRTCWANRRSPSAK